jgi:monoamine oxidase
LKAGAIRFDPALPEDQVRALSGLTFGEGFKVFLKFSERFYPDILMTQSRVSALSDSWDGKIYYDAMFGKGASDHVLGLFTASQTPLRRARLGQEALIADVVAELDEIFGGAATPLLREARAQNWTQEPRIQGSYSMAYDYAEKDSIAEIFAPLGGRVHFAGEALGGDAQSTVHGAALSARALAAQLV